MSLHNTRRHRRLAHIRHMDGTWLMADGSWLMAHGKPNQYSNRIKINEFYCYYTWSYLTSSSLSCGVWFVLHISLHFRSGSQVQFKTVQSLKSGNQRIASTEITWSLKSLKRGQWNMVQIGFYWKWYLLVPTFLKVLHIYIYKARFSLIVFHDVFNLLNNSNDNNTFEILHSISHSYTISRE